MYNVKKVKDDVIYVGGSDRRLNLFENVFPIPRGVSYNAYVVLDEKTVLMDTVDKAISGLFFENLAHVLDGRKLDYVVVNHMEPDHAATLGELILRYPDVTIICNKKTEAMIGQFFEMPAGVKKRIISEGETLNSGRHLFMFVMAPMVHWPEAMVTYDATDKTLYSADAFGTFGALSGGIFADEYDFKRDWLDDARRYYTNIVGKYGTQVQALLKKAKTIEIETICPLHGPIWRKDIAWFVEKYQHWSTYTPEDKAVLIAYGSIYGNTENTAEIVAARLSDRGIRNIAMYDVSMVDPSVIVSEAFRCSHLVFASSTYNAGIFLKMETVMHDIWAHNLQNRTVSLIENGTWAATSGSLMKEILGSLKNMTFLGDTVSIKSSVKEDKRAQLVALADAIADDLLPKAQAHDAETEKKIEPEAMFKISYGLFVLTAKDGDKDNGCIINTAQQVTDSPKRISVAVNKKNYTHDMIAKTGVFNVSVLSTDAEFKVFEQYGFSSGKENDKMAGQPLARTENGVTYLTENTNAVLSAKVVQTVEYETHTVFFADVTEAKVLSGEPSMTYDYYFANVKPKPAPASADQKGWVCKICGWVHEGEELPEDLVCPLCKHGAEDFERL
ncbi:MAG: flavin reductase [Clostridia bacterium]|nr:flavin reductase [Clostridia bacterium]